MPEQVESGSSLGSWIRQRRKALDLTQAALAGCVGCADVTIRKLEAAVTRPSRQLAARLAACLEIPPDERAVFLQVARGERRPDRLPPADPRPLARPRASVAGPIAPLPRDTVPPPAPLPPGSRMPLSRNPLFVGRDADLRQLAQVLTVGATAAIGQIEIAAATGLGGIGKTQLACEFVHRYGQFFAGGIFWLSFADPAAVPAEVAACGGGAGMALSPEFDTLPLDTQVQRVRAAWKEPIPRLLVFDNCEDEALLDEWRPPHGGCRVLITSRRRHWDLALGVQPVALDVLPRADSLVLLRQFRPDLREHDADLAAIAETLGDLPLALHLAGSFLAKYRHAVTPAQYRARLHTPTILDDRSLRAAGLSPTQHVQHVTRTFEQSFARLDPADPTDALARTLLTHAACCAPGEPLPRWFLLHTLDLPEADVEGTLRAEDAVTRVLDLGLLDTDAAGSLRLHRLVAAFVRTVARSAAAQADVEATMLQVADALHQAGDPRRLLAVEAHLRFITEHALPRADARAAELSRALGMHVQMLGAYAEAQRYFEQALGIQEQVLEMEHPDTARSLYYLGRHVQMLGAYVEARRYMEQSLVIERVLEREHPDTTRRLNPLSERQQDRGVYVQAQHAIERALVIQERALGPEHPDTARSLQSLGVVLWLQGAYTEAQRYFQRALVIQERVLGPEHPVTARCLNSLGEVLYAQGAYVEAQRYHERALAIRKRVLGVEHPDTARSLHDLGEIQWHQGNYAEAQRYHERALVIQERVLGTEHPDTARSLHSLGLVLRDQGDMVGAQHYVERALMICARRLGPNHPETHSARATLATFAIPEPADRRD
ncbi:MAG TPA: helix-turn-helix transcriptional regulator [Herpetosiphonaceae bacterium]